MMNLRRDRPSRLVDELAHTRQLAILALGNEDRLMTRLAPEMARQVQVLPGKILMYHENFL
jgi:hypothetical protein